MRGIMAPDSQDCHDLHLGSKHMVEINTGRIANVKIGDGKNYADTLVVGCENFARKDDGACYKIEGGQDASLAVVDVVASKDVKIQRCGTRTQVSGKGGKGTRIASTVVKDSSQVTIESQDNKAFISRDGKEGEILAENIITGSSVTMNETNPHVIVTSD